MKKAIFFSIVMTLIVHAVQAQIKIGDNVESISPYALLELESVQKGLLIPRLTTQERNTYFGEDVPPGLLIYNTDTQKIQYVRSRISASTKNIETYWENISNDQVLSQSMGGTSTVENPVNGMIFYQENEHELYVYNTALKEWVLIAGANFLLEANPVFNQHIRYQRSNGEEEVLDLSSFSNTDSQTIHVSPLNENNTLAIAISNGNTQTLDLSSLSVVPTNTDSQTLNVSPLNENNTLTIAISNGNTQTVDLSRLSLASSNTDSQTIQVSPLNENNTLIIAISNGNTQTVDLSPLSVVPTNTDSQTIQVSALSGNNTLTIAISNGNTQTIDLSSLAAVNLFEVSGNVVRSSVGTSSYDFVFASDTLDNQTGAQDDARFFFDKSKAAFRAGYASGSSWNEANIGERSFGMGYRTQASGDRSIAMGNATEAQSYAATAFGSYNTIVTQLSTNSWNENDRLFIIGNGSSFSKKSDAMVVLKNGNIGIGDSTPTEGTLVVSGTIVASGSITASASLTPDYVFEYYYTGKSEKNPSYRFPTLMQIEHYLKANHHLPNVPNAEEVKTQGGIVLNRALELQLEKIEELYLYTIEQEKIIIHLEKRLNQLMLQLKNKK